MVIFSMWFSSWSVGIIKRCKYISNPVHNNPVIFITKNNEDSGDGDGFYIVGSMK